MHNSLCLLHHLLGPLFRLTLNFVSLQVITILIDQVLLQPHFPLLFLLHGLVSQVLRHFLILLIGFIRYSIPRILIAFRVIVLGAVSLCGAGGCCWGHYSGAVGTSELLHLGRHFKAHRDARTALPRMPTRKYAVMGDGLRLKILW